MFFIICPRVAGAQWADLESGGESQKLFMALFHTGWFVESLWSQTLVIHMIRTPKIPFIQSRASKQVALLTTMGIAFGTIIPYTPLAAAFKMNSLPLMYFPWLAAIILAYMLLVTAMKKIFVRRYSE
jgi:Mg2+-importing ATPase